MNGNTMYLVCVHHPDKADSVLLADRCDSDGKKHAYTSMVGERRLAKFFEKHAHCGGGFDHFTIAYTEQKDHDVPKPELLANGVHLVLREAANSPAAQPINPQEQAT